MEMNSGELFSGSNRSTDLMMIMSIMVFFLLVCLDTINQIHVNRILSHSDGWTSVSSCWLQGYKDGCFSDLAVPSRMLFFSLAYVNRLAHSPSFNCLPWTKNLSFFCAITHLKLCSSVILFQGRCNSDVFMHEDIAAPDETTNKACVEGDQLIARGHWHLSR